MMRIVGGRWRGQPLARPKNQITRPTSDRTREALFSILTAMPDFSFTTMRVLDLFAGTGALGFEALSRGASYCLFVDDNAAARGLIRDNMEQLQAQGVSKVFRRDATRLGPRPANIDAFDLVFADPPYGKGLAEQALAAASTGGWIAPGARIIVEEDRRADFVSIDGLDETDRRQYGDTELIFLTCRSS